jgi:pyruvate kinase
MSRRLGKIVATIGPATSSLEKLESLFLNGVDIFRMNFSHGSHKDHESVHKSIRSIGSKYDRHPTIFADLQGPKLRVGTFEKGKIVLESDAMFRFDLEKTAGDINRVNLPHPEILDALHPGAILLLDDGKIKVEVINCNSNFADVKVLVGGALSDRKGVNVPEVMLKIPFPTKKDLEDIDFVLGLGVDWIALSFVQSVEDIENSRKIINGRAGILTKLEKPLAIKSLEPIVEASDSVMVARGDLGVEMNHEDVPPIQRRIIDVCNRMNRPVIVATQMLESMISSAVPTRAEVSDIATAVYSCADATMLSAESASGKYPFESVAIMDKVIRNVEADPYFIRSEKNDAQLLQKTLAGSICIAAKYAVEYSSARAIVLFTDSYETVAKCSKIRPCVPIYVVTESKMLASKVGLFYGVYAFTTKKEFDVAEMTKIAKDMAKEHRLVETGDTLIVLNDITGITMEICKL